MRVNRENLLQALEMVAPGLAKKETLEQSDTFVFNDNKVQTFNDEIAATADSPLKGVEGAVKAAPLLSLLQKLPEDDIDIEYVGGELVVKCKRRRAGIAMEAEVLLPFEHVESPDKWKKLPDDFLDAIAIVGQCASTDESQFALTCVHVTGEWLEACDNFQLVRYPLKTKFKGSRLARRESIKHIVGMGMTDFSETSEWLHFRNDTGVVLSCRRYVDDYPDLAPLMEVEDATKTVLPKGIAKSVDKAIVFSEESPDRLVDVSIKSGKLRLKGQGAFGWYEEIKKITYDGDPLKFRIAPRLLVDIVGRANDCEIANDRLKIDTGKYTFVACLATPEEDEE